MEGSSTDIPTAQRTNAHSLFSSDSEEVEFFESPPLESEVTEIQGIGPKARQKRKSDAASRVMSSRKNPKKKTYGWNSMTPSDKSAAMKTFADVYGKNNISNKLACITDRASNAIRSLRNNVINARDNANILKEGFMTDPSLKNASPMYLNAFKSLKRSLSTVAGKPLEDVSRFIMHDVHLIHDIEEENDNFVRTVGQQCEDIVLAYPTVPPAFMFSGNIFDSHASSRAKGGKRKGAGRRARSTRGGRGGGRGGRTSRTTGSRTRKTTGLRPLMSEMTQFCMRTSS